MKKIKKAVFPVAGFGTRFLPATKAMPKELLPIIDKPLIQYAVEEAVSAGIDTLIFVTGRNKRAIEDHFDSNPELELALKKAGKYKQAEMVRNILPQGVECIFVRQPEQIGLGDAILCAERAVSNEPFLVILADDFLVSNDSNTSLELIQEYEKTRKIQLSVMEVDGQDISKYGVITPSEKSNLVASLVEKPNYRDAPSNLATIGRYILTPDIFDALKVQSTGVGGEIQLTDAINQKAAEGNVNAVKLRETRFDCGNVNGYISAIKFMSNLIT